MNSKVASSHLKKKTNSFLLHLNERCRIHCRKEWHQNDNDIYQRSFQVWIFLFPLSPNGKVLFACKIGQTKMLKQTVLSGFDDFCLDGIFFSLYKIIDDFQQSADCWKNIYKRGQQQQQANEALALILQKTNLQLVINRSTPIIRGFNSQRNYTFIV